MCTCGWSATAIFSKPDQLERSSHTRQIAPKLGTAFSPIFYTIPPPKLPLHVSAATSQFSEVVRSIVNSESLTDSSVNKELVSIFNHRTHRVEMFIMKKENFFSLLSHCSFDQLLGSQFQSRSHSYTANRISNQHAAQASVTIQQNLSTLVSNDYTHQILFSINQAISDFYSKIISNLKLYLSNLLSRTRKKYWHLKNESTFTKHEKKNLLRIHLSYRQKLHCFILKMILLSITIT